MIPKKLNIGSGKDFRTDYLNIDISSLWMPDIIHDISKPSYVYHTTDRFGDVMLNDGEFEEIMANDILEHVRDLVATMSNCLRLLKVGGVMNIIVPYDLSYGAWQDPTHVRAFNERSWLYYTDWFWYLGWGERFKLNSLEYMVDDTLPPVRQICAMKVQLEKVSLSESEKEQANTYYDRVQVH